MTKQIEELEVEVKLLIKFALETFEKIDGISIPHRQALIERTRTDFKLSLEKILSDANQLTWELAHDLILLIEKQIRYYSNVQESANIFSLGRRAGYVETADIRELRALKGDLLDLHYRAVELAEATREILG